MRTKLCLMTALLGAAAATGAAGLMGIAGCSSSGGDDAETSPQSVTETRDATIHSLVALEGGCTAIKIGPKHLLTAARCVTNKPAYAVGKKVRFTTTALTLDAVASADAGASPNAATDAATDASPEAGRPDAAIADAGVAREASADAMTDAMTTTSEAGASDASAAADAAPPAVPGLHEEAIARVEIHPSYLAKCGGVACQVGKTGGGDVADVAVIIVAREITDIPSAPIDLDPVAAGDGVLVVAYGCEAASTSTALHARETKSAPAKSVIFTGSPYQNSPELLAALASSYVITLGPGATPGVMGLCADRDFGAPLLRANGSAVVGVASNVTFAGAPRNNPTTNAHTRVDAVSHYNVGTWLGQLGAVTTKSCSMTTAGCPKAPDTTSPGADSGSDAGEEPLPPTDPTTGEGENPPSTGGSHKTTPVPAEQDPTVKKKSDSGGCSASPAAPLTSGSALLLAGVALAFVARRRRR